MPPLRSGSTSFGHHGHWGRAGAGVLLATPSRVLVLLRSDEVTEPGTWNLAGGAIDPGEDPLVAALRELREETGLAISPSTHPVLGQVEWDSPDGRFRYTTSVVRVPAATTRRPVRLNWENDEHRWVDLAWLNANRDTLHPGFRASLDSLLAIAWKPVTGSLAMTGSTSSVFVVSATPRSNAFSLARLLGRTTTPRVDVVLGAEDPVSLYNAAAVTRAATRVARQHGVHGTVVSRSSIEQDGRMFRMHVEVSA